MAQLDGIVVTGDLILLNPEERIQFYVQVCKAMGLDPLLRPLQYFEQIDRNGKRNLILYALRSASAQLSRLHKLSSSVKNQSTAEMAMYEAAVVDPLGRAETAVGAVSLNNLKGKAYADAFMTAQTKAKRRAVLDYAGYALLDESEIEGMNGSPVDVTEEAIKGFVAAPAAPQANAAPAVEVLPSQPPAPGLEPVPAHIVERAAQEPPFSPNQAAVLAIDPLVERAATELIPQSVAPDPVELKREMDKVFARLSTYRRDVLQRGGMKPSKGFGIQAKWEKFLRKHAPDKTLEQYQTLLIALDLCLQQTGEAGVVARVEQEIA